MQMQVRRPENAQPLSFLIYYGMPVRDGIQGRNLMKSLLLVSFITIIGGALAGCANPLFVKLDEDSKRISSLAQVAKDQLEDCRLKNDKSACDDVEAKLNEIITSANGIPDIFMGKR